MAAIDCGVKLTSRRMVQICVFEDRVVSQVTQIYKEDTH